MGSSSNARSGVSYNATVAHLRRVLGGFVPGYGDAQLSKRAYKINVPASKLPVAVLAREVMVVFGAADLGGQDKVAWCYGFTVDGVPCALASTKWGLRLHLDAAAGDADAAGHLAQRVLDKLAAAQRVVNKSVLLPQLDNEIAAGNITITNQYATLRGSYDYFREGAEQAYAGTGRLADRVGLADLIGGRGAQEGWWNTLAMVSAYFSMGCVFLKCVILRRRDCGWAVTRSVCTFLNMPGVTEGDRRCSAVAAAGCRGQVRGGVRLAVPPVSGPVPGSWREMTPRQLEDRRWSWRFR